MIQFIKKNMQLYLRELEPEKDSPLSSLLSFS